KVTVPILVDTIDDRVQRAYAAMPDRIYVLDAQGRVVYKGPQGPAGFQVEDVPPVLDRLLRISLAGKLFGETRPNRPNRSGSAPEMRERLASALSRVGLEEKENQEVIRALEKKMQAYRDFMNSRGVLLSAIRQERDVSQPLAAYQDALRAYEEAAAKIDKE